MSLSQILWTWMSADWTSLRVVQCSAVQCSALHCTSMCNVQLTVDSSYLAGISTLCITLPWVHGNVSCVRELEEPGYQAATGAAVTMGHSDHFAYWTLQCSALPTVVCRVYRVYCMATVCCRVFRAYGIPTVFVRVCRVNCIRVYRVYNLPMRPCLNKLQEDYCMKIKLI